MSFGQNAPDRKTAIESLRFKKNPREQTYSSTPLATSSSSSLNTQQSSFNTPPPQSRDASVPSRYFSITPASAGNILVPSSSPPPPDSSHRHHPPTFEHDTSDVIPGLVHSDPWGQSNHHSGFDPLSAPSGFVTTQGPAYASFTRPSSANGQGSSGVQGIHRGEPPRKRLNRGVGSPPDPIDFFATPGSPEIQRPGQRRRPNASAMMSSASDDDSLPDTLSTAGPSKPRIVRGHQTNHPEPASSSEPLRGDPDRFTKFKIMNPLCTAGDARAAWQQAGGDEVKASQLLNDPSWKHLPPSSPRVPPKPSYETGRVKELDDAKNAQRARVREMGKKSAIYQNRVKPESEAKTGPPVTPPVSKSVINLTKSISTPATPASPEVVQRPAKRVKRKVIESDLESDYSGEEDRRDSLVVDNTHEKQTLEYFNTAAAEALQELTGCKQEQANKIIELRPFISVDDFNTRLGQGRKKAGPAGISPRLFEDCASIFQGYGKVDNILSVCEDIGATLRAEIATWTSESNPPRPKRDGEPPSSRQSPSSDIMESGALSLRTQALLGPQKPKYYISKQPSFVSDTVQLKEYQMLGINWLNLLYREKLSCILADEMGLGKTVQVISFLAHLKEQGCKGPHLIVVPSSTLENWTREFKRFAPAMVVDTYYASKENRTALRQELRESQRHVKDDGWEVLLTTYNLAQGDSLDRKFFREYDWDTCIFDEGHVLKNFQSQRYQALLRYTSKWRLLLTGTPLQNNLQELVSLMNFILPGQFAAQLDSLRAVFKTKGDSKVTLLAQERVSRAKKMLTPFVLRRRKDQVLKDLPKKSERIEWCEMTSLQRSIYTDALHRSRKTIFDLEKDEAEQADAPATNGRGKPTKKKTRGNARSKDKLYLENSSNVLMDLRKAALHPMLFRRRYTDEILSSIAKLLLKEPDFKRRGALFDLVKEDMTVMTDAELQMFCAGYKSTRKFLQEEDCYLQAGKVKVLMKLLNNYRKDDRRVLIFSQFTQVLDILQKVFEKEKIKYLVLTGSTPVDIRQSLVDEFTDDESISVFLLSTKAGGMGINLTAASVVIMFDQDFNPHNDKQAQDRAYRIGQKRDVEVVKLITKGSIEEDMLELGMTKLALDEAVAGEEGEEKVEREMKTSLMNVVRKKLEEVKEEPSDTKMDVDEV